LIKSLPPLHEVARMAGVELPEYLGEVGKGQRAADPAAGRPSP
jgi:flotillin